MLTYMHTYVLFLYWHMRETTRETMKEKERKRSWKRGTVRMWIQINPVRQRESDAKPNFPGSRICEYLPVGSALHARCNAF